MASYCFGQFPNKALNGEIDWDTDTIKVSLHTSSFTPNQDTMDYYDDVDNEVSGTGYTSGGATLANASLSYDGGTNVNKLDADDVTWSSSTITARYAVVYKDTGVDSTSPLIGYVDFEEDIISNNGDFTISWSSSGIITFTVA